MKAVDTANERPDEALSFVVSTTFIRFSVDEWHLLEVGCLRGGGVFVAEAGRPSLYPASNNGRYTKRCTSIRRHTCTLYPKPSPQTCPLLVPGNRGNPAWGEAEPSRRMLDADTPSWFKNEGQERAPSSQKNMEAASRIEQLQAAAAPDIEAAPKAKYLATPKAASAAGDVPAPTAAPPRQQRESCCCSDDCCMCERDTQRVRVVSQHSVPGVLPLPPIAPLRSSAHTSPPVARSLAAWGS